MPTAIPASRVQSQHGLSVSHERMDNGELRFRLLHEDGTGYILTRATPDSGWQNSHVHQNTMETYIVQSGWMALAELIDDQRVLRIFGPNAIVTTKPGVTHNVYLSAGAVIHTVKHGVAPGADRDPGPDGPAFDIATKALDTEAKVRAAAFGSRLTPSYSEEYRHFDNLIWQVPAWATAIFALSIQSILEVLGLPAIQGQRGHWLAVLIYFLAACIACFSLVLARFRIHQRAFKGFSRTPIWKSAATWMQCLVTLESAALIGMGLSLSGTPLIWAIGLSAAAGVAGILVAELTVRRSRVNGR